jgi:hypothetical protein
MSTIKTQAIILCMNIESWDSVTIWKEEPHKDKYSKSLLEGWPKELELPQEDTNIYGLSRGLFKMSND